MRVLIVVLSISSRLALAKLKLYQTYRKKESLSVILISGSLILVSVMVTSKSVASCVFPPNPSVNFSSTASHVIFAAPRSRDPSLQLNVHVESIA